MALTFARVGDSFDVAGKTRIVAYDITFDSSYPAGGEAVAAADFGLRIVFGMLFIGGNAASGRLNYVYDTTNKKIIALFPTGGATAAPTSLADPISTTGGATASAVDAVTPNITPGRGKEVGATADLSSITVRAYVFGN